MEEYKITSGYPYPLGVNVISETTVNFAYVCSKRTDAGLILYNTVSHKSTKIPFADNMRIGNVCCLQVHGIDYSRYEYSFYIDDDEICDPYAKAIAGDERWGKVASHIRGRIVKSNLTPDANYKPLCLDYCDSVFYLLHVRGFTKHKSSGVSYPGTFEGLIDKIGYLKELGVTTVELMPAYDFEETEPITDERLVEDMIPQMYISGEKRINYWGYKEAHYFAPKTSYAKPGSMPTESFRNLVDELHLNGMEIVMQFYFPNSVNHMYILDVLRYWVSEYHIDGIHLMGANLPLKLYATDPMLADIKLMYYDFDVEDIYGGNKKIVRRLARYNDGFMFNARRFLKSDEAQSRELVYRMRGYDDRIADICYLSNYDGFTLMDTVSYDRKHNEINGENNRDGSTYNASWNCGIEGATTKKTVNRLRRRQIKNAIVLSTLSQQTPMIRFGDEFGNSQKGNNNPYCVDSVITWLNWNDLEKNSDIYEFYKRCLTFRSRHGVLHPGKAYQLTDYLGVGYPDYSIHGEEAWMAELDDLTRHFALLYSEAYGGKEESNVESITSKEETELIYVAINMHWSAHSFALPKPPANKKWKISMDTYTEQQDDLGELINQKELNVRERSIVILTTCDK